MTRPPPPSRRRGARRGSRTARRDGRRAGPGGRRHARHRQPVGPLRPPGPAGPGGPPRPRPRMVAGRGGRRPRRPAGALAARGPPHPGAVRVLPGHRGVAAAVRPGDAVVHPHLPRWRVHRADGGRLVNSLWVSSAAAVLGAGRGLPHRLARRAAPTCPAARVFAAGMWLVLLLPSWLPALGWERLVEPDGVLYQRRADTARGDPRHHGAVRRGPRCSGSGGCPSSTWPSRSGLGGLGQEFEDAARVHGASRRRRRSGWSLPILAPAIWSALAIGFAESVSDFGVASTLAFNVALPAGHLPALPGHQQLPRRASRRPRPSAGSSSPRWPCRSPCRRGRCAAGPTPCSPVGTRPVVRRQLSTAAATRRWPAVGRLFFVVALGVPGLGAVLGVAARRLRGLDLASDLRQLSGRSSPARRCPGRSMRSLWSTGSSRPRSRCVGGLRRAPAARRRIETGDRAARLPAPGRGRPPERGLRRRVHLRLQPPVPLAARASTSTRRPRCWSSPTSRRACPPTPGCWSGRSPRSSAPSTTPARTHGAGAVRAGARRAAGALPAARRWPGCSPSAAIFLELPDLPAPLRAGLAAGLGGHQATTWATTTSAWAWPRRWSLSAIAFLAGRARCSGLPAVAPRRVATASEAARWLSASSVDGLDQGLPGRQPGPRRGVVRRRARAPSSCSSGPPGRGRPRCCAAWPGSSGSRRAGSRSAARPWPPTGSHLPPERRGPVDGLPGLRALAPPLTPATTWPSPSRRSRSRRPRPPAARRRDARAGRPRRTSADRYPASSRAASSSGWRWPGRWSPTPGSCSATSRSPTSTPTSASGCGSRSPRWSASRARRPSTSPTTRPRRSPWPTRSACSSTGRLVQFGTPEDDLRRARRPRSSPGSPGSAGELPVRTCAGAGGPAPPSRSTAVPCRRPVDRGVRHGPSAPAATGGGTCGTGCSWSAPPRCSSARPTATSASWSAR